MNAEFALRITEADHVAQVFRELGGAAWETREERDFEYALVPPGPDDPNDEVQWICDVLDGDALVDGRVITETTAMELLGVESLEQVREIADEREALGRALAEQWIADRAAASGTGDDR